MTVKARLYRGLQGRGDTSIDGNFTISKSGTTVSVGSGTFVDVDGTEYSVPAASKDIGTSSNDREIGVWLHEDSNGNTAVHIGENPPNNVIQRFVPPDWFRVPAKTSDLSTVEMHAFGWIDGQPQFVKKVQQKIEANGGEAVSHTDLQKLKKNGAALELKDIGTEIQVPSNASEKAPVNIVGGGS